VSDIERVRVAIGSGVARIEFNRPERLNALDLETAQAFRSAVLRVLSNGEVRAIILAGAGRAFIAGGDLAELKAAEDRASAAGALIDVMHEALLALHESGVPSIAALKGPVAGAGMSIALMTTFALASEDASLNMAYIKFAAPPDCGGSWALTRLVGPRRAAEIALLSEPIEARRAFEMGLVNRVVAAEALDAEVNALAAILANGPQAATRRTLGLIASAQTNALAIQLGAERNAFVASAGSDEFDEALAAFFERRAPNFEGR